MNTVMGFPH